MELRGSELLFPIIGGVVGGVLMLIIIFLVLVTVICVKCKARSELNTNIDNILGKSFIWINELLNCIFIPHNYLDNIIGKP